MSYYYRPYGLLGESIFPSGLLLPAVASVGRGQALPLDIDSIYSERREGNRPSDGLLRRAARSGRRAQNLRLAIGYRYGERRDGNRLCDGILPSAAWSVNTEQTPGRAAASCHGRR